MNKKLLGVALLCGLGVAQVASAQEFDDRWYLTGAVGFNLQDNDRGTNDAPFGTIGVGKFLSPNWSLDGELNYQNPNFDRNQDLNWSQYGASLDARYHFIQEGRSWNPYLLAGLGYQRHEQQFDNFPNPNSPGSRKDGNLSATIGVGLQGTFSNRVAVRTQIAYRGDLDDGLIDLPRGDRRTTGINLKDNYFADVLASVGVIIPLGPAPTTPIGPAPTTPSTCADQDSDGDGVNDCDDKCPGSQAGQTIGPDGCPVPVSIDLKGVNFDFNKATLRPDAVSILTEAVGILTRYPELKAEVAGHTDLCGSDAYNQKLSERRASAVYNYLTSKGVDASRLSGPVGYGESRPLENTPQTLPQCKNERNRRTELNVQN